MSTLQEIRWERLNAARNVALHCHLCFEVLVHDGVAGNVMRQVRWWEAETAGHLADAAFCLCQVQHGLDAERIVPARVQMMLNLGRAEARMEA